MGIGFRHFRYAWTALLFAALPGFGQQADVVYYNGKIVTMSVKYVVVWKRENGAWKWHVDIWNPSA